MIYKLNKNARSHNAGCYSNYHAMYFATIYYYYY